MDMTVLDKLPSTNYVGLAPWCWVQLESQESPGPFPFVAGVAPEVVASLHEAHGLMMSAIETAISVGSRPASCRVLAPSAGRS